MKIINSLQTLSIGLLSFMFFSCGSSTLNMIQIPHQNYKVAQTEISQKQYKKVMKSNPSEHKGNKYPVENVSWYDTLVFCNRLSIKEGLTPVYSIDGKTNPSEWNYIPHKGLSIDGKILVNKNANGYRLLDKNEYSIASAGGEEYKYSGSKDLSEVAWYAANSQGHSHEVSTKKPNAFSLYDMSGNVLEWIWDSNGVDGQRKFMGGCWKYSSMYCGCYFDMIDYYPYYQCGWTGFRVAQTTF